jgi:hypothetical protein
MDDSGIAGVSAIGITNRHGLSDTFDLQRLILLCSRIDNPILTESEKRNAVLSLYILIYIQKNR